MKKLLASIVALVPLAVAAQGVARSTPIKCSWPVRCAGGAFSMYGPAIPDDGNEVTHVYWTGLALADTKGLAWTKQGSPPMVAPSGFIPPGFGPASASNRYSLGSGSDVLDFTGDFTACVVFTGASLTTFQQYVSDGQYQVAGWYMAMAQNGVPYIYFNTTGVATPINPANSPVAGLNVMCAGRAGANGLIKLNAGATATNSAGTITAATGIAAQIGCGSINQDPHLGTLYEVWITTDTPTDALFTSVVNAVKSKYAINAW